jgi:hypothetical protein
VYTASIIITGGAPIPISIVGNTAQTMGDLITQINNDIVASGGLATFTSGDDYIRISVTASGASTITFTDTNLVSTLFGGSEATVAVPVNGHKYTLSVGGISYPANTINFSITDAVFTTLDYLTEYELVVKYKTYDGEGKQSNDLRLPAFNYITSTDSNYNQFNLSYS